MSEVDPDDDTVTRYVVHCYGYDPARRERRHRVVAAFDNPTEFDGLLASAAQELRAPRASGLADPGDHYSGVIKNPGHDAKARLDREWLRAIRHGVIPTRLGPPPGGLYRAPLDPSDDD